MKSLAGQTAVQQEQTHGRKLPPEGELARTQKLRKQALRRRQPTQQVMMTRQLAHEQETLALQKAVLRKLSCKMNQCPL